MEQSRWTIMGGGGGGKEKNKRGVECKYLNGGKVKLMLFGG